MRASPSANRARDQAIAANRRDRASGEKAMEEGLDAAIVAHNADPLAHPGLGGGAVDSVNGQTGTVVLDKADVGLANADNTADADKPVSTAVAAALNGKLDSGAAAASVQTIAGLIAAGGNVTVTGLGTLASPFIIAATGGGGGLSQAQVLQRGLGA